MRKIVFSIVLLIAASSARAATSWLASNGSGSACTRSAPCSSLALAITAAGFGGVVRCVDNAEFGSVVSGFPFSLICDGVDVSINFIVLADLSSDAEVVVQGVSINCNPFPANNGIRLSGSGTLHLRNVKIRNCLNGVFFIPSGSAKLVISNSSFYNNSTSGINVAPTASSARVTIRNSTFNDNRENGVVVQPAGGAFAIATLEDVSASGNQTGLRSIGLGSRVSVFNSVFTNNFTGVLAQGRVDLTLSSASNNTTGVNAFGGNGVVTLARSRIFGNATGLQITNGQILTFGNNEINGNTTDGAPSSAALPLR